MGQPGARAVEGRKCVRKGFFLSAINLLRVEDLQSQSRRSKESKVIFACPLINTGRIDVTREIS